MNVEIVAEAALFPEKEYVNGIAVAVQQPNSISTKQIKKFLSQNFSFYRRCR
jgi:hypothetical protein